MSPFLKLYAAIFIGLAIGIASCKRNPDISELSPRTLDKEEMLLQSSMITLQYGSYKDASGVLQPLLLDLYFPAKRKLSKVYPLAVMIHGGAYVTGDRSEMAKNCAILADSGFVAASIDYRLGWDNGVGDCDGDTVTLNQAAYRALQDANAALRYLAANAASYSIDTSWVFIGGNSAGGNISLNTTYINEGKAKKYFPQEHQLLGPVNTADNELTNTFTIKGVCNMWGALPDSLLITPKNAKPCISFHGTADNVVPYNIGHFATCDNYPMLFGSLCIHRQLLKYSKPVITNLVIGGGHGPDVYTHEFLMSNTACFWKRVIKGVYIRSRVDTSLVSSCN